jgi:hypothetical protein
LKGYAGAAADISLPPKRKENEIMANKKMRGTWRKLQAVILSAVMIFSLFQMSAAAFWGDSRASGISETDSTNDLAGLKDVYKVGDDYYVNACVYLLYSNVIPGNIQQGFSASLFGPSGNNTPYFTAAVNLTELLSTEGVNVQVKSNGYWYISYQTCTGYTAESLWDEIVSCMDATGQAMFTNYFKDNYVGYVLKCESQNTHIDGVYRVDPAYVTEVYINNSLSKSYMDNTAQNFNDDVLAWLNSEYGDINWNDDLTEGTFSTNGHDYTITLTNGSAFDKDSGAITYVEKTTDFFVAAFYYTIEDVTPPAPVKYTLTVNWVDQNGIAISDQVNTQMDAGSSYTTEEKEIEGYSFSNMSDDSAPASGVLDANKVVTYVYTEVIPAPETYTLTVNWVDENGNTLAESKTETLATGSEYSTEQKNISGYTFKYMAEGSDPVSGIIDGDKAVTYVYSKNSGGYIQPVVPQPTPNPEPVPDVEPTPDVEPDSDVEFEPTTEIEDEDVPLAGLPEMDDPQIDMDNSYTDTVISSNVPKTGDMMWLYAVLAIASGMCLILIGCSKHGKHGKQ